MKWKLPKRIKEIEKQVAKDPVSYEDLEKAIELINAAKNIDGLFRATFELAVGEFEIDSTTFQSIKLQKSKNKPDKVIINHSTPIISTETTIETCNIYGINVEVSFIHNDTPEETTG